MRTFGIFWAAVLICAAWAPNSLADDSWRSYANGRFGYSAEYPDIFSKTGEPDNGDGVWLESVGQKYRLTLSGGYNALAEDGESKLKSRLQEVAHVIEGSETFGNGWYRIVYSDDGGKDGNEHLFHEYGIVDHESWASFIFAYPRKEEKRFAAIIPRLETSLALAASGEIGQGELNKAAFSLKNGRVRKDGKELDCEIYEMPRGIDNGIKTWAVIGTETSDTITQREAGVWFFGGEGDFMTFIALESENEYQDIVWSPAGDRLVLVRGSGVRPDMFFDVYGEGMEKQAEFSGMRGEIQWIDSGRIGFTRIDDVRDSGDGVYSPSLLRLSAVLYDSAINEATVLKESTDTQNYRFNGISKDGESIVISEYYVKNPKDWADEEKVKDRKITVPMPAAG
ncbi:MAG: hypothetical protein LBP55_10390 [Candidatus Adiutrix sp.]|jgi:hypothetical protein|nr:hypothetical protein [Candidatus Adiutrix sp.]